MRDSLVRIAVLILAATLVPITVGCRFQKHSVFLSPSDLSALETIRDTSSGLFHNSQIDIKSREGGAVEVVLQGEVIQKPEATGDVWIPILLLRNLPEYFQITDTHESLGASLEAYQFKGGLWCIAAVLAQTTPGWQSSMGNQAALPLNPYEQDAEQVHATPVKPPRTIAASQQRLSLRLVLASSSFSERLPFLIPANDSAAPVSISITLPKGGRFISTAVLTEIARDVEERSSINHYGSVLPRDLPLLPAVVSGEDIRASATLYSPGVATWDFSNVEFRQPGILAHYRSWFIPSAVIVALCGVALWLRFDMLAAKRERIRALDLWRDNGLRFISNEIRWATTLFREQEKEPSDTWKQLEAKWKSATTLLNSETWDAFPPTKFEEIREPIANIREILPQLRQALIDRKISEDFAARLLSLNLVLHSLSERGNRLQGAKTQHRIITRTLWLIAAGVIAAVMVLLATLARAQGSPKRLSSIPSTTMLCDLAITATPHDPQSWPADAVDVVLRFSPLTGNRDQGRAEIQIGAASFPVSIGSISASGDPALSVRNSASSIILETPVVYSAMLRRINALAQKLARFKVPDAYPRVISTANQVTLKYTLQGAEERHIHARFGRNWLHLFPFDTITIGIPIEIRQPALLSQLQLQKPSNDSFADPSIQGLSVSLAENDAGDKYEFRNIDIMTRTPIGSGQIVIVQADFHRSAFQRWWLTVGILVIAVVIGVMFGWYTTLPEKSWKAAGLSALGVFTIVFAIRTAVLAAYKDLPTVITGQGTTIFELAYIAALIVMGLTCVIYRRLHP